MRDPELMVDLLRQMRDADVGWLVVPDTYGSDQKVRFNSNLLVDEGHAVWISEQKIRITTSGYNYLETLDKDRNT